MVEVTPPHTAEAERDDDESDDRDPDQDDVSHARRVPVAHHLPGRPQPAKSRSGRPLRGPAIRAAVSQPP